MKRHIIILLITFLYLPGHLEAQLKYYDAAKFPLYGKATKNTENRYERLLDSLKHVSRRPVWNLSRNSAGLAIRFCSNSTTMTIKWENLNNSLMNHMTPTGTKGLNPYTWVDEAWKSVNSGRPIGKVNQAMIIVNMEPVEREYMLYLPLHDGVILLSIGTDAEAPISVPRTVILVRTKLIVFYGTSILQGGCANRPEMAHTNIISRRLNREIVNLGPSGNALLDYEIVEVISSVDAGVYVLNPVSNVSSDQIYEKMETFYRIPRDKHPRTPIIFTEDPVSTHALLDKKIAIEISKKNKAANSVFKSLETKGEKNIYIISSEKISGEDGEAAVDGIHFTDLGVIRYAGLVCPVTKKVLKK